MDETRKLAQYLSDLTFDDLSDEVVETAKSCILDTLGVALLASGRAWSKMTVDLVRTGEGAGKAGVWGQGFSSTMQQAALANGTAAHGMEMDDRVPTAQEHPGCVAVPVALAIAEETGISGRELLTSVVAGYELGVRVGLATRVKFPGIHPSGHKAVWVAVGTAAKALGLDLQQTLDAYGIAGSMAGGVSEFQNDPRGTMVKRLHCGLAASNGVVAALLAKDGFTGPSTILEGPYGYCHVYSDPDHPAKIHELTDDLGGRLQILNREVKPYAAWGGSHLAIDAVGEVLAQGDLDPAQIDSVLVAGSSRLIKGHALPYPESLMAAQYSLPFLTAAALARGPVSLTNPEEIWRDETLQDPELLRISGSVKLIEDSALTDRAEAERHYGGARVEVTLVDGRTIVGEVHHSKGTLGNPLTAREIEDKFRLLAGSAVSDETVEGIVAAVRDLDGASNADELARLLSA